MPALVQADDVAERVGTAGGPPVQLPRAVVAGDDAAGRVARVLVGFVVDRLVSKELTAERPLISMTVRGQWNGCRSARRTAYGIRHSATPDAGPGCRFGSRGTCR